MTEVAVLPPVTLVLGGARSGKSRYAERLVERQPGAWIYLATAEPGDAEMAARIRLHQARRGARWRTIEAPLELTATLSQAAAPAVAVLVDCLTLWLANMLGAGRDVEAEVARLIAAIPRLRGPVVFVSNEVGLGIVPEGEPARRFRDHAGQLHQGIAAAAQSVALMVAGIALMVKAPAYSRT